MSCIAGIIHLDGAPVDRELLGRMTASMKARAPDACDVWCSGDVGFGHAMLRVSTDEAPERQPCTLDGQVWITADARIDGQSDLIRRLRAAGQRVRAAAPDVELILHAYAAFGESLTDHLIGDFAFALWDNRSKSLLCARDHFGVRPFFYVKTDRVLLFASDLDALLLHPSVSRTLDEEAVADFLLFGSSQHAGSSIFLDIRRLPPATRMKVNREGSWLGRYWDPPLHPEVGFRRSSEYIEQFQALFKQAVEDRLRGDHIALELSGGMDSTAIAAVAAEEARTSGRGLTAYTIDCSDIMPDDQEAHFAGLAAAHLNIPVVYQSIGDYALFERLDLPQLRTAEPSPYPDWAMNFDRSGLMANRGARVLLSGQGGDAVFAGSATYHADLLRSGRIFRFLAEAFRHAVDTHSLAGMGLRSAFMNPVPVECWTPPFPDWINEGFCKRTRLEDRWRSGWAELNGPSDAYHQLKRPWLSQTFESYESLKMPLVVRHPFFDTRLVTFLLGLPNSVSSDKRLMRQAMRGRLPESVRDRPKTSLADDQFRLRFSGATWRSQIHSNLAKVGIAHVDQARYARAFERYLAGDGAESTWSSWLMITPQMLNIWFNGGDDNGG